MLKPSHVLAALALALGPALACARPPLIYHHIATFAAHPGGSLNLRLGSQDVKIVVRSARQVSVTAAIWADVDSSHAKSALIARLAPTTSVQGTNLLVRSPNDRDRGWHDSTSVRTLVSVVMPPDMNVDYKLGSGDLNFDGPSAVSEIRGDSGSGDTRIRSSSKTIAVDNGSGDLAVDLLAPAVEARLATGSGDVSFQGSAQSLALRSGSGDVRAHASAHAAVVRTGSGDMLIHWGKLVAGASIQATAGSGDVHFDFPATAVLGGVLSSGSGAVESAFPVILTGHLHSDHHFYHLAGGAGAVTVDIYTGSGDLILRKQS